MADNNDQAIAELEEALRHSEQGLSMIITAEIQRADPNFVFGILVSARQSLTAAKANIDKAIALLRA